MRVVLFRIKFRCRHFLASVAQQKLITLGGDPHTGSRLIIRLEHCGVLVARALQALQ